MKGIFFCCVLLLSLFIKKLQAQKTIISKFSVDSVLFSVTRAKINALPNDPFERFLHESGDNKIPYRILQPLVFKTSKRYPLIITLHNSSRIGIDNESQLEPLAKIWLLPGIRKRYPAFVLAPQFSKPSSNYEVDSYSVLISKPSQEAAEILVLVKELMLRYPIDPKRIFWVGYSMGASTAQNLMNLQPDLFAGLVSIVGVPDTSNIDLWSKKPIYLIHGALDNENPYLGSVFLSKKLDRNRRLIFIHSPI